MVKSLEQLRKERDKLVRISNARASQDNLSQSRRLEGKKLKAEISVLKNPRSTAAKKSLRSAGKRFGSFITKKAKILGQNINAALEEEQRKERAKKSRPKRIKTTRRRIKRR